MNVKLNCTSLYNRVVKTIEDDIEKSGSIEEIIRRASSMGFFAGLCEKVCLGACPSAMIKPDNDDLRDWAGPIIANIAGTYDLKVHFHSLFSEKRTEIWVARNEGIMDEIKKMLKLERNTPAYHNTRAWLIGIPDSEIDHKYHERA